MKVFFLFLKIKGFKLTSNNNLKNSKQEVKVSNSGTNQKSKNQDEDPFDEWN